MGKALATRTKNERKENNIYKKRAFATKKVTNKQVISAKKVMK